MQLSNNEQEILLTYQNWLKENNLSDKCNVYFIEENSILVFQTWNLQEMISETIWLKTDNEKWQFYIKNLSEKINKFFLLSEVIEIEKKFVIKTFKKRYDL